MADRRWQMADGRSEPEPATGDRRLFGRGPGDRQRAGRRPTPATGDRRLRLVPGAWSLVPDLDGHDFHHSRDSVTQDSFDAGGEGHRRHRATAAGADELKVDGAVLDAQQDEVTAVGLQGRTDVLEVSPSATRSTRQRQQLLQSSSR